MFRQTYQEKFTTLLYGVGSKPLLLWGRSVQNGHVERVIDPDINSSAIEVVGRNVATCSISCPENPTQVLGIRSQYLYIIIKNLGLPFSFEVQVLDDSKGRRRFCASTFQTSPRVKPFMCSIPLSLSDGWNHILFDLADFTKQAYGTKYLETLRVQLHANCRLRRVFFSKEKIPEDDLPSEFRIVFPFTKATKARHVPQQQALTVSETNGRRKVTVKAKLDQGKKRGKKSEPIEKEAADGKSEEEIEVTTTDAIIQKLTSISSEISRMPKRVSAPPSISIWGRERGREVAGYIDALMPPRPSSQH